MAGRIKQEDIEAVRERADLAGLVSQYLALKKAGHDRMVGLCPFHQEKTASFGISPSKGLYYCFGCGAAGDSIRFLQDMERLSFTEAVERLAQLTGVELRYEGDSVTERRAAARRRSLHLANEEAAKLYVRTLLEGKEAADARTYLAGRGIDPHAAEVFELGFAPASADFLLRRLAKDFGPEVLLEAGLATRGEDGRVRDRFRGRITFPVHDLQGRAVGFGARILPTDPRAGDQAKYINTAETVIYRKNELLYNVHRARQAIARSGEAIVVEGYTDVIALATAGVENSVATCGTALGEGHFRLLNRFAQRAALAFDSDEAGAKAAERAFAFQEQFSVQAVVMILPEGLDPADFVRKEGPDAVRALAAEARPLVEYMIRRTVGRHELSSVEGKSAAVADALSILEGLQDPVRRSEYGHLLADLAGVGEASVMQALERRLKGRPQEVAKTIKRTSAQERVEREMLKLLAHDGDVYREFVGRLDADHFRSTANRAAFEALRGADGDVSTLVGGADEKLAMTISSLALEPLEGEPDDQYAYGVWMRLREFLLKSRSDAMRGRLQKMNPTTDSGYEELFSELVALDGELRRLRTSEVPSGGL